MNAAHSPARTVDQDSGLSPQTVEALHQRLLKQAGDLRAKVDEQMARLSDKSAEAGDAKGNTFIAGAEGAVAAESDDEALAMLEHARVQLLAVQEALQRVADGSFGVCAECGEPIGQRRLEVVPQARLCRDCQGDEEAHPRHQHPRH